MTATVTPCVMKRRLRRPRRLKLPPMTPGRNLAVILEVAAMNNRQKKMGYNAAIEFTEQIDRHFDENMGKDR